MSIPHDPGFYEAVATSLSFLGAAWVYGGNQRDRRRAQASMISAWFDLAKARDLPPGEVDLELHLTNRSDQPAHEVTVTARTVEADSFHVAVLPPGTEVFEVSRSLLAPEDWWPPIAVDLHFRNAAGRTWRRTGSGHALRRKARVRSRRRRARSDRC